MFNLLNRIQSILQDSARPPRLNRRGRSPRRSRLESLEQRSLLTTIVNTSFETLPGNVSVVGNATHYPQFGEIRLTENTPGQQGSLLVSYGSRAVAFSATARVYLGNDPGGGDGMSFGYGSLSGSAFGEAGTSSGVWISIDTHEGDQYSGRVYIIYNGTVVDQSSYFNQNAHSANGIAGRGYYTMTWSVTESGLFQYNHPAIGTRSAQLSGWGSAVQSNWRFGIGARTGAAYDEHAISELTITDNTSTPTNLSLSASTVNENDSGATVGTLSTTDAGGSTSFTYSLVSGTGSTHNSSFQIVGNQLRTATGLNYEAGNSRSVRIRTTDQAGLSFEQQFSVSVINVNEAPTDISLSVNTVNENLPAGTAIGAFLATEPDFSSLSTHTWSLVSGSGSTDNSLFVLQGNTLKTNATFDYESRSNYAIRVRATDQGGLTTEKAFTISIDDVDEIAPQVSTSSFLTTGTLSADSTSLDVTFSEPSSFTLALGTRQRPATSASQIKTANPGAASGVYWIDPNGGSANDAFQVYCDMTTDGGGWMLGVNSVFGFEPDSNNITSNTGIVGLSTAHTRNLNSYFDGTATAEVRHEIDGTNRNLGFFHGKYVADSYEAKFTGITTLSGHSNSALLSGSYNASFGTSPGGTAWFYNNSSLTTLPSSPSLNFNGPWYLQTFDLLNSYRIWIRGTSPATAANPGGANIASNYELRRAGADGLLGSTDDPIVNISSVTMSGNTATLNFAALPEDVYRLTAKDSITDAAGNALDGDGNGTTGGNWRKDFVVGALTTSLTSPNGFVFDPEFGGVGAGQLVQGPNDAFDGLGRSFLNGSQLVSSVSSGLVLSEHSVSGSVTGHVFNLNNYTGQVFAQRNLSLSAPTVVDISGFLRFTKGASFSNFDYADIQVVIDGVSRIQRVPLTSPSSDTVPNRMVPFREVTTLSAGSHTIELRALTSYGGGGDSISRPVSDYFQLDVLEAASLPGGASSLVLSEQSASGSVTGHVFNLNNYTGQVFAQRNLSLSAPTVVDISGFLRFTKGASFSNFDYADIQVVIDGVSRIQRVPLTSPSSDTVPNRMVPFREVTTLSAGSHTIELRALTSYGGGGDSISRPVSDYFQLDVLTVNTYPTLNNSGATLEVSASVVANIAATRKVTVPSTGSHHFARTVDAFTNSSGSAITVPARTVSNLGADAATTVFATSDGDLLVEPTDLWFGTDDGDGTGTPAIIHLLHGPYGLQPTSVNVIEDNVEWTYNLTVGAGETKRLAYFTVLGTTRSEAIAAANALVTTNGFGGEAAAFLTNDELSSLVNFQFNTAPTDLTLSSNTVAENSPADSSVGNFSTVDANSGDVFTYSLVSGTGDTDNAQFTIVGNTLKTVAPFDFETKSSYSTRVRTTDQGGLSYDKVFVVQVTDVAAQVGGLFDGPRAVPNALRLAAPVNELTVTFADAVSTAGGSNGVNSVLNPSNWQILKNHVDVTAQLSNVTFGYDSERENYAAVLSFVTPLDDGQFTVRVKDSIHDESGASFDGDLNGTPGGDFVRTFVVAMITSPLAESRVNTTTAGDQTLPIIAMNAAGSSVVVWQSFGQDGNGWGVYAQRYNAAGNPVGSEILVPDVVNSDEGAPHVAMDAAGNFVVTWNALGRDGSDIGIYARRFHADGTPHGTDFLVNTHTTGDQRNPSVAMAPNGNFVISWESWNQDGHEWGVYAQRYNAAGVAQGPETLVNTNTTSFQWNTHLAIDAAGNYTIVWDGFTYDGNEWGVFGQRFSSTGAKLGGEFKINTFDAGLQGGNAIGMDDAGNFVVTWSSYAQDGSGNGIYGKRYASTGDVLGSEFLVNTYSLGDQQNPGVTMDADGDFVITWASFVQDGDNWGVYGQRYAPSGVPQGGEFSLNTYTSSEQWWPNVGMNSNGDIAAVWHSFGQDGTDWGVYRRQFLARVTPTDIVLSKSNLLENAGSNAVVGTLSAIDPDAGDTFFFSLPSGVGDNSAFNISGTTLRANSSFDFEMKSSFSVTVRVTDAVNRTFDKQFTIQVTDVNEAPTEISLTHNTVPENSPAGTVVGILSAIDPDADDSHTFIVGTGAFTKFTVLGNQLVTSEVFNFESQVAYSIGVFVVDESGLSRSSHFSIFVTDVNEAPTDISLANSVLAENLPSGTSIGSFSTTDPDSGNSFTHTLVSGVGDTDNAQFTIDGNTLKTVAPFDFETKSSYSIRVRTTDQGGLSFEKVFTISVTDVQEDVTAPQSLIAALPAASNSLTFSLSASAADPGGAAASGVFEIDFYYSTGGSFIKFATSPASNSTASFTGSPNTTYWFRSIARDNAGNVESKTSADTYTRIGDIVPPTTQVTSATHNSGGLFTINMTGSKASGTPMTAFDVYVVIDSNAPVLVGTTGAGAATAGVYSASLLYQGLTDGNSHSYRFYSVGKDSAGNVEAAPVSGDVTVTVSFSPGGLTLGAIDVQNGSGQRSYVRHLDLLFSSSTGLSSLANTGRVRVERFGIDATSVNPGTGTLVSGFTVNQAGNRLKLDFGATGLGGLRQAGNGFYRVLVDIDGNGNFADTGDGAMEFHRLFGDADGNGIVDIADTNLVTSQIGRTGTNLDGDLDGNGAVNSTDRLFTVQQRGKKLLDPLLGWLDD